MSVSIERRGNDTATRRPQLTIADSVRAIVAAIELVGQRQAQSFQPSSRSTSDPVRTGFVSWGEFSMGPARESARVEAGPSVSDDWHAWALDALDLAASLTTSETQAFQGTMIAFTATGSFSSTTADVVETSEFGEGMVDRNEGSATAAREPLQVVKGDAAPSMDFDTDEEWASKDRRRGQLIDKQYTVGLTSDEEDELVQLQAEMKRRLDKVAPISFEALETLEGLVQRLEAKQREESETEPDA